jgi:hypothetical protein
MAETGRLTLAKFRLLSRIRSSQTGYGDVTKNGNVARTYQSLLQQGWVEWDVGRLLRLTSAGDQAYELGVTKGWTRRLNPAVDRMRRVGVLP